MHTNHVSRLVVRGAALALATLGLSGSLSAKSDYNILADFLSGTTNAVPVSALVSDSAGNLYGTTPEGGSCNDEANFADNRGCGTVFELIKPAKATGAWVKNVIYTFK